MAGEAYLAGELAAQVVLEPWVAPEKESVGIEGGDPGEFLVQVEVTEAPIQGDLLVPGEPVRPVHCPGLALAVLVRAFFEVSEPEDFAP